MDAITLQPAAESARGTDGLLLIKAYHHPRRIPAYPHPGAGLRSRHQSGQRGHGRAGGGHIPSAADGCVDLEKLRAAAGEDTAGLM